MRSRDGGQRGVGRPLQPEDFSQPGQGPVGGLSGSLEMVIVDENKHERMGPADVIAEAFSSEDGTFIELQIPIKLISSEGKITEDLALGLYSEMQERQGPPGGGRQGAPGGGMGKAGGMAGGSGGMSGGPGRGGPPGGMSRDNSDSEIKAWFMLTQGGASP